MPETTQLAGMHEQALRLRLAAPPVDGKANTALLAWAASTFGIGQKTGGIATRNSQSPKNHPDRFFRPKHNGRLREQLQRLQQLSINPKA